MYSIILGTIILGFVHALIPNHWVPLVVIAKAESWNKSEGLLVATLTASAHVVGTVILGITLGLVGSQIGHRYEDYVHIITPILLIIFGLIYFTLNILHNHRTAKDEVLVNTRARTKWIIGFVILMFLSSCLEIECLFVAAGAYGIDNLLLLALIYAIISISGIVRW